MSSDQARCAPMAMQRLSVVTEPDLLVALHVHQRNVEQATGLRISLSQVASSLMRQGLGLSNAEKHAPG